MQPHSNYSAGTESEIFSAVSFVGFNPYCGCLSRDVAYRRQDSKRHYKNKSRELSPKYIVFKHVTYSEQYLTGNLRGGGCMRDRGVSTVTKRKKAKRARVIKRDIY